MESWFGWRKEKSIRIIIQTFIGAEYANQLIYTVIKWLYILIANRPVIAETINAFSFKIFRTEAKRYSSPVIGTTAQHSCPEPIPFRACFFGIGFTFKLPTPIAGVKITKRAERRSSSPWRFPGLFKLSDIFLGII